MDHRESDRAVPTRECGRAVRSRARRERPRRLRQRSARIAPVRPRNDTWRRASALLSWCVPTEHFRRPPLRSPPDESDQAQSERIGNIKRSGQRSPILVMRPSRVLPPVEFARRQAEEGSELTPAREGAGVLIVAMIADAVTGLTPGMVINRLAVSSALTDAASYLSIAPIASSSASIWPTSERSAPRTQSGTTISPFSLKPSAAMRFRP